MGSVLTDGRIKRTAATRENILSVTREIILSGESDPTSKQIATQAGITTRTLFRHFSDMEALYQSLISDAELQAFQVMEEPFPETEEGNWRSLIDVIIDRRVRVYESLLPLYVSTIWRRYQVHQGATRSRKRLKQVLPNQITNNSVLFEALDATLGMEYWVSLRRDQKLSQTKARNVVELAVDKLLA